MLPRQPIHPLKPRRIFCFGDSISAGVIPSDSSGKVAPYGEQLKKSLRHFPGLETIVVQTLSFKTLHICPPQSTGSENSYHHDRGMGIMLDKIAESNNPLLIILVGSHDLAEMYSRTDEKPTRQYLNSATATIVESIIHLHQMAHSRGIQTIALGLPPSLIQEKNPLIKSLKSDVNRGIEAWVEKHHGGTNSHNHQHQLQFQPESVERKIAFVPFPIQSYDGDSKLWARDGFHFTKEGYEFIGKSLAPFVEKSLKKRVEMNGK